MLSKRDVQVVRIAVRWKWFTPEQGEDVLFLKRKFGSKLTVEEIIRRRAYLEDNEIEQLAEAANQSVGRRAAPRRAAPRAESVMAPSLSMSATTDSAAMPVISTPSQRPSGRARPGRAMPQDRLPTRMEPAAEDATDPNKRAAWSQDQNTEWMARAAPADTLYDAPEGWTRPAELEMLLDQPVYGDAPVSEEFDEDHQKTVVTSMEEILRQAQAKAAAKARAQQKPEAPKPYSDDRTAVADAAQIERLRARLMEVQQPPAPVARPSFTYDEETEGSDAEALVIPTPLEEEHVAEKSRASFQLPVSRPESAVAPPPRAASQVIARARAWTQAGRVVPSTIIEEKSTTGASVVEDEEEEVLEGAIGPYQIVRLVARGSRGALYRTRAPDGTDVALKLISADVAARPGFIERTRLEAMRASNVVAPEVVRIIDVGLVGARFYVAMQYVDAWTLEERLDSGDRPDLPEALGIGRDIARALAAAEQQQVVHRDVGPSNILVGRSGEAHLTGFALAKDPPTYPAPEGALDHRSDLYALGATLYALVTGEATVSPTLRVGAFAPDAAARVIDRLLDRTPEQRYQHAADVANDLEQAIAALRAVGFQGAGAAAAALPERALALRAAAGSAVFAGAAIAFALAARWIVFSGAASRAALNGALAGAIALIVALLLLSALGLVRRGELPLPASSAWLVGVQDGAGSLGALLLVAGVVLAPLAILNIIVGAASVALLASWFYGMLLRRTIALRRPDRGVGRMLAVLGDPHLARWRLVHVPMLATIALLATARFAFLAYFAST